MHRPGGTGIPDRSNIIMFYIIEKNYVGPNIGEYVDADMIIISTSPAVSNSSREEKIEGWCGNNNDWAIHAHGEYATIEEARAAITNIFGEVRKSDANGDSFSDNAEGIVETYKEGKFEPVSRQETADWAYDLIQADIKADTSDERIGELVDQYEEEANSLGYTLDSDLEDFMKERRQELLDELEDMEDMEDED